MKLVLIIMFTFVSGASALTFEKVNLEDKIKYGEKEYQINGAGLRTKRKFGINWKVYVAALYLKEKSQDPEAILASPETKMIKIKFLRSVDKETLIEGWSDSLTNNCKFECERLKDWIAMMKEIMMDVNDKSEAFMVFEKDATMIQIIAKDTKVGRIVGEAFRKNLLAAFIGSKPPLEDLKNGLLGKLKN